MTLAGLRGRPVRCLHRVQDRGGLLSPTERFAAACDEAFPQMGGWFTRFYRDSRTRHCPYPGWFVGWVAAEGGQR